MKKPSRRVTVPVVGLLVVAAGGGTWLMLRPADAAAQTRTITSTIATSTVQQSVTADGTISPKRTETLTLPSGGTVTAVLVSEGEKVKKGEVLARMDTSSLAATLAAAEATLTSAREQYSDDVDDDADDSQLIADKASITSAAASVESAQENVDDGTMTAPFSGTISAVGYDTGDSTGSTSSSGGTDTSTSSSSDSDSGITLISTGSYEVSASVGSSDLADLKKGLQAQITPTGSSTTVYGVVKSIGVVASSSGDSTSSSTTSSATFPVTIEVTGSTKGLYAGSSATVEIITKQLTNVITVPSQALSTKNGKTYVTLISNGKKTRRYVTVGDTYSQKTVVTKGLEVGDEVLVASFTAPRSTGSGGSNRSQNQMPGGGMPGGQQNGQQSGQQGGQQ